MTNILSRNKIRQDFSDQYDQLGLIESSDVKLFNGTTLVSGGLSINSGTGSAAEIDITNIYKSTGTLLFDTNFLHNNAAGNVITIDGLSITKDASNIVSINGHGITTASAALRFAVSYDQGTFRAAANGSHIVSSSYTEADTNKIVIGSTPSLFAGISLVDFTFDDLTLIASTTDEYIEIDTISGGGYSVSTDVIEEMIDDYSGSIAEILYGLRYDLEQLGYSLGQDIGWDNSYPGPSAISHIVKAQDYYVGNLTLGPYESRSLGNFTESFNMIGGGGDFYYQGYSTNPNIKTSANVYAILKDGNDVEYKQQIVGGGYGGFYTNGMHTYEGDVYLINKTNVSQSIEVITPPYAILYDESGTQTHTYVESYYQAKYGIGYDPEIHADYAKRALLANTASYSGVAGFAYTASYANNADSSSFSILSGYYLKDKSDALVVKSGSNYISTPTIYKTIPSASMIEIGYRFYTSMTAATLSPVANITYDYNPVTTTFKNISDNGTGSVFVGTSNKFLASAGSHQFDVTIGPLTSPTASIWSASIYINYVPTSSLFL